MNRVITISRQFGSGGRTIGKELSEKLGIPCYDRELIEKIAEETGYANDYIQQEAEYAPGTGGFAYSFLGRGTDGLANADRIWFAQRKVILELASKGSCVIVGRCADYLLKDRTECLNVFVYASKEYRAERIVRLYGESSIFPERRLAENDKKRKLNYKYFTEQEWGKTENYHLCIDSGYWGIQGAVNMIMTALKEKDGKEVE